MKKLPKKINNNDLVYYKNNEGFGIYSELGINPKDIILKIKKL